MAVGAAVPGPLIRNGLPLLTWGLIRDYYLPLIAKGRTRPMPEFDGGRPRPQLLIVSPDVVDTKMAGPGMRYLEMARALAESMDVVLAVPADTGLEEKAFHLVRYWEDRPGTVQVLMENCDVALISGYMVEKFPFLDSVETPLVVDLYDPFVLENLYYYSHQPLEDQNTLNEKAVEVTNLLAKFGDFFICGNERQRDFWLGLLAANGRITPRAFQDDPTLHALIDVVGIGLPRHEPVQRAFLAGIDQRVPKDARIVLWGGGIWNWLDPLTLIRAWPEVIKRHPSARLVLLGTRHPNPAVPVHQMARRAESLATEIGEKDRTIVFLEWVGYHDREALLAESSVGVTLHPVHAETRYSMRTRVLDYLWARLPVVMTEGDTTSEWISEYGVGRVVPPDDPAAVAQALVEVLSTPKEEYAPRFDPIHEKLAWSTVVAPLRNYCSSRTRTSDRKPPEPESFRTRVLRILYEEGAGALYRKGWRALRKRLTSGEPQ
jgi:glycosyltransferase involved in cell wall biosynthesis